jgi:hypothetical protein
MNKKGMSAVVTTLLILVLTVVVLAIVWVLVKNLVVNQSGRVIDESEFLKEELEMVKLKTDGKKFNITLRKGSGKITQVSEEVEVSIGGDVFSIIDLSGSMCMCYPVTRDCCTNNLGGDYGILNGIPHCFGTPTNVEDICRNTCGGNSITPIQNANQHLINTVFSGEEDVRVGFVGYNNMVVPETSGSLFTLTDNTTLLDNSINLWESGGGTCICCGINKAIEEFGDQSTGRLKTI